MINWKHIAEILTQKWLNNGKLPIYKDGEEYNYVYAVIRNPFGYDELRYAHTEIIIDGIKRENFNQREIYIKCHGQIDKHLAIYEAWPELNNIEQNIIMTEILGKQYD